MYFGAFEQVFNLEFLQLVDRKFAIYPTCHFWNCADFHIVGDANVEHEIFASHRQASFRNYQQRHIVFINNAFKVLYVVNPDSVNLVSGYSLVMLNKAHNPVLCTAVALDCPLGCLRKVSHSVYQHVVAGFRLSVVF